MPETCSNCKFGHAIPWTTETASGVNTFCRRDPPEFLPPGSSTLKPAAPDGWCGQWATAKARRAKA